MFYLTQPTTDQINRFLESQRNQDFTYSGVGLTRTAQAPPGFVVDHNRVELGQGEAIFERACEALRQWRMFDFPWLQLCWPTAPLEVGTVVGVRASHFGFWSLHPCRIVYVLDEATEVRRFGFGYGTLPAHGECGEERFVIEWDRRYDAVAYDIFAFSKPNHLLAKLGYPWARSLQKRFARESKAAVRAFVGGTAET